MKKVSIITIARKVNDQLRSLIDAIKQELPGVELIVVIDDDIRVDEISGVITINTTNRLGPGNARNTGVSMANGDQLIFIDSDLKPENNALNDLLSCLEGNDFVIGNIQYLKSENESALMTYTRLKGFESEEFGKLYRYGQSGFMAITKEAFFALKGFNSSLKSAEDNEFGYRAVKMKLRFSFCRNAIVYHPPKTDRQIYLSHVRNKSGRNKIAKMYPGELPLWKSGWIDLLKNTLRISMISKMYKRSPFLNHPEFSSSKLRKALFSLQWNEVKACFRILFFNEDSNSHYE